MLSVQSYITPKNIKKKNRGDLIARNIFRATSILSASFVVIVIIIIAIRG